MKFFSASLLLALTGSLVSAVPTGATANTTSVDVAGVISQLGSFGPEDGQRQCQSTPSSGTVKNAEAIVKYLRGLPASTNCVTNKEASGYHAAGYYAIGNVEFIGVVLNKKCSKVTLKCHALANYFQSLITACEKNGHITAAQYLDPDQFSFTDPKLCKKSNKDFAIAIEKFSS